jgi:hypothetical protein
LCENGFANECEDGGDWTPREPPTDRLILAFRLMVVLRDTVFPFRVTLVVRVALRLRLNDPLLLANGK